MTEPTSRPGDEHTPAPNATPPPQQPTPPASDARPTFQTAKSEAADVAAQAVAQRVAATAAAAMAAAEAAAAREAAEAAEAARAAEAAASASMAAAAAEGLTTDGPPVDASTQAAAAPLELPQSGPGPTLAAPTPVPVEAAALSPADASMAAAATAGATPIPEAQESVAAAPDATTVATPKPSRRPVILAWSRRLAIFAVSAALLVGGVLLGSSTFQRTRAVPTAGVATEMTEPPAAVAKEFISALATGDADAVRSALSAQPNKDLTDEFTKFGIKKVTGVDTLGTSVDGTRSATEVLLHTINTQGNTFDINLIILVNGNQIEGFR